MIRILVVVAWIALGLVIGAGVAWASARVQSTGFAPVGISSLIVGAVLGILLAVVANSLNIRRGYSVLIAVTLIALVTVAAQHAMAYREYLRTLEQQRQAHPEAALLGSSIIKTPSEFITGEAPSNPNIVYWWALDAALIVIASAGSFWMIVETTEKPEAESPEPAET